MSPLVSEASSTILGDLNLPVRANIFEVLITEDKDLPLRSVQRELVKALLAQLGNLYAGDLGPEEGAQMIDLCLGCQQVRFSAVCLGTRVRVLYIPCQLRSPLTWRHPHTIDLRYGKLLVHIIIRVVEGV